MTPDLDYERERAGEVEQIYTRYLVLIDGKEKTKQKQTTPYHSTLT